MIGAGFFIVTLLLVVAVLVARKKRVTPHSGSVVELLEDVIVNLVSMYGHLDKAWEVFRPQAYEGIEKQWPWKRAIRKRLRNRSLRAMVYIARIEFNVKKIEKLGLGVVAVKEDNIGVEIVRRATACKILLGPVKRGVCLYSKLPFFMWMVLGHERAKTCLYGGRSLLHEYSELAGAVLALTRAYGQEYHYDCLVNSM